MQNNNFLNGVLSGAVMPQLNYVDAIQQLEQTLGTDAKRIQLLMQQGTISNVQGKYLLKTLIDKFKEISLCKQIIPNASAQTSVPNTNTPEGQEKPLDLFNKENPDFFKSEGRMNVLDYIKGLDVDKDEITKIAGLVEKLEQSAVDSYLKKSAHNKSLNDENSAAKSKLTSCAQNPTFDGNNNRIFTRADIGKMSGEDFIKNEKLIMEQLKQGLIK